MKCQFIKQNKDQCNAHAIIGDKFCFSHSEKTTEAKKEAVSKGGNSPKTKRDTKPFPPIIINGNRDILKIAEETINLLRTDPMTPQKAKVIAQLLSVSSKVFESDPEFGVKQNTLADILRASLYQNQN